MAQLAAQNSRAVRSGWRSRWRLKTLTNLSFVIPVFLNCSLNFSKWLSTWATSASAVPTGCLRRSLNATRIGRWRSSAICRSSSDFATALPPSLNLWTLDVPARNRRATVALNSAGRSLPSARRDSQNARIFLRRSFCSSSDVCWVTALTFWSMSLPNSLNTSRTMLLMRARSLIFLTFSPIAAAGGGAAGAAGAEACCSTAWATWTNSSWSWSSGRADRVASSPAPAWTRNAISSSRVGGASSSYCSTGWAFGSGGGASPAGFSSSPSAIGAAAPPGAGSPLAGALFASYTRRISARAASGTVSVMRDVS